MSEKPGVNPSTSIIRKRRRGRRFESESDDTNLQHTEGSKGLVQDQIILAPEIMCLILEKLDFKSLRQARLVCKSWLLEVGVHLGRRGAILLHRKSGATKIRNFLEFLKRNISSALPLPFQSVHVNLSGSHGRFPYGQFVDLLTSLCPPLALTRFSPCNMPLALALPLICLCSSSLEYLSLVADTCEVGCSLWIDPKKQFLKLKHLKVYDCTRPNYDNKWIQLPSIIDWIVKASPDLETYDLKDMRDVELANRLLMEVDIKNLMTLKFCLSPSDRDALEQHLTIPFCQLERLKIHIERADHLEGLRISALIVDHSVNTLTKLGLSGFRFQEAPNVTFPTCPKVKKLFLGSLLYSSSFIIQLFPSLQELDICTVQVKIEEGWSWSSLVPFLGVKTLEIRVLAGLEKRELIGLERPIPEVVRFFEKFPDLECLYIRPVLLRHCCGLKASGDPSFSNLLAGVKHVVLDCLYRISSVDLAWDSGSSLAVLTGIKTFTLMRFNQAVAASVVKELQNLKILLLPWGAVDKLNFCPDVDPLVEVARGVEKVLVKNCCYPPSVRSPRSQELLRQFFESAPNAECGCRRDFPLLQ